MSCFSAPPRLELEDRYQNMPIHVGGMIRLKVNIDGEPAPTVTWYKNNAPLRQSHNLVIDSDESLSSLFIKRISVQDNGEYKLVAKNQWGQSEVSFNINVAGQ